MLQLTTGTLSYLRDHEVSTTVFAAINWVSGYDFCIFCCFPLQPSNDEKVFKHWNVNSGAVKILFMKEIMEITNLKSTTAHINSSHYPQWVDMTLDFILFINFEICRLT